MATKVRNSIGTRLRNIVTKNEVFLALGTMVGMSRKDSKTVQVVTNVSIGTGAYSPASAWIDTDGYDTLCVTIAGQTATANNALIQWSNDNLNIHGEDSTSIPSTTDRFRSADLGRTRARYARILVKNGDTVSHTYNAFFYLKV